MNKDNLVNVGIVVLAVILAGLLACEMFFPLSGTTLLHMIKG